MQWQWISFGTQIGTIVYVVLCAVWFFWANGSGYFMRRSVVDCTRHMIVFSLLAAFAGVTSLAAFLKFRPWWYDFGVYFACAALCDLLVVAALLVTRLRVGAALAARST